MSSASVSEINPFARSGWEDALYLAGVSPSVLSSYVFCRRCDSSSTGTWNLCGSKQILGVWTAAEPARCTSQSSRHKNRPQPTLGPTWGFGPPGFTEGRVLYERGQALLSWKLRGVRETAKVGKGVRQG